MPILTTSRAVFPAILFFFFSLSLSISHFGANVKGMDQVGKYGSNTDVAIGKVPYRDFMHFSGGKSFY